MTSAQLIFGAIGWLALAFGTAWVGSRYLPDEWYKGLNKPSWNPPNWIFAPVWSVLYLLMALAVWLVWKQYGWTGAPIPLGVFVVQLLLNAAWTWTFFGLHRIDLALGDIVVLWAAILMTINLFWKLVPLAGILLLPYLAWVSFATALTWKIWQMNKKQTAR